MLLSPMSVLSAFAPFGDEEHICIDRSSLLFQKAGFKPCAEGNGIKPEIIEGAIRFSFSSFNNEEDIIKTVEAIKDILPKIRIKRGGRR